MSYLEICSFVDGKEWVENLRKFNGNGKITLKENVLLSKFYSSLISVLSLNHS